MEQKLTTTRLRLRPIRRGDAPRVQALCGNWNVARMLSRVPYPNPVELVETWTGAQAAAWKSGSAYNFAIEHRAIKHRDSLIGVIGVARRDDGNSGGGTGGDSGGGTGGDSGGGPGGDYEIGYWLGEPWWGKGLMTEAVGRIAEFARADLGLDRLRSDYFADNPASGRIQEKCGFRITGRGRLNSRSRGCEVEAVFTELKLSGAGTGRAMR
jgi:RimJ/RimL family protein N-acetyltransferase